MIQLHARPVWLISGAVAVLLLVATIAWDDRWRASAPVPVSQSWSVVLESKPSGFDDYQRRIHRVRNDARAASNEARVKLAPNGTYVGDLCVYRITTPVGGVLLEFTDRWAQTFVDLESFAQVESAPTFSARQFIGEFLDDSPSVFVFAAPNNRCKHERAA